MRAGRFVCVALPILLTIGAIVALMIGTLSGVAHNRLYIFSADLSELSLDEKDLQDIVADYVPGVDNLPDISNLASRDIEAREITASNLGLGKRYDVTLWGYCKVDTDGKKECKKPEFDWASKNLNKDIIDDLGVGDMKIELPDEIESAIKVFSKVTKYTEIAFIVALVALALELIVGIFANCTRVISCLTWLIAIIAIILTLASCALATAMGAVVTGAIEATAKTYGARATINTNYLACIWIGAAFAIAASLFWLFTLCCCKPEHGRHRNRGGDGEKLLPQSYTGGYAPVGSDNEMTSANPPQYYNNYNSQPAFDPNYNTRSDHGSEYGWNSGASHVGRPKDAAYEPYSHH